MKKVMYNFDTTLPREGTGTLKYDVRSEVFGRADVIPMWIADMDFECPSAIREAISRRAGHNLYGYDIGGERCAASVRGWLSRRGGWETEPEWLRFTTGVVAGLGFAIRAFTDAGDGVVIQTPVYPPFRMMAEVNDRRVVTNPLRRTDDGRFEMDFEDLERKFAGNFSGGQSDAGGGRNEPRECQPSALGGGGLKASDEASFRVKAIILCNPHNPVGRVFTRAELMKLGELCEKYNVVIIADEIHSDLVFKPHKHTHIASLDPRFAARCVTFVAPSKTFNIAGLATSVAIIPSVAMREKWDAEYAKTHIIDGTMFGHIALCAAYDECEEWADQLIDYLAGNVEYVRGFLAREIPRIKTVAQEGTYLMWLDFRELMPEISAFRGGRQLEAATSGGADEPACNSNGPKIPAKVSCGGSGCNSHKELMTWLATQAGLGLSSGADFGREGVGFARLNVATSRATLEKAMGQLAAAVRRLG